MEQSTNAGADVTSTLSLMNANPTHSGLYSCLARIDVFESNTVESMKVASVSIRGERSKPCFLDAIEGVQSKRGRISFPDLK